MERRGFLAGILAAAVAPLAAVLPKGKHGVAETPPELGTVVVPRGCWFSYESETILFSGIRPSQTRHRYSIHRCSDNGLVATGTATLPLGRPFRVRWTDAAGTHTTNL